jgi:hypothetical protein
MSHLGGPLVLGAIALSACYGDHSGHAPDGGAGVPDSAPLRTLDAGAAAETDAGDPRTCDEPVPSEDRFVVPAGCEGVFASPSYCASVGHGRIRFFDLEGNTCERPTAYVEDGFGSSTLGWAGNALYLCESDRLVRIDISDGIARDLGECYRVTTFRGGILTSAVDGTLRHFATDADAAAGRGTALPVSPVIGSRMAADRDTLVLAHNEGPPISLVDYRGEPTVREIPIDAAGVRIDAMDLLETGEIVIVSVGDPMIRVFDSETGRLARSFANGFEATFWPGDGIACATGSPPPSLAAGEWPAEGPIPIGGSCERLDAYARTIDMRHSPSIPSGVCGEGTSSNYAAFCERVDPEAGSELHVVSIYEAAGDSPRGIVDVEVRARPRPIALALASYDAVTWRLAVEPGAEIDRVIVHDRDPSAIEVLGLDPSVPIERLTTCGSAAYSWETRAWDVRRLVAAARIETGLVETTFQGCYAGARFTVPYRDTLP